MLLEIFFRVGGYLKQDRCTANIDISKDGLINKLKVKKNKISVNGQQIGIHEETIASRKKTLNDAAKVAMMISFLSFNVLYFLFQAMK